MLVIRVQEEEPLPLYGTGADLLATLHDKPTITQLRLARLLQVHTNLGVFERAEMVGLGCAHASGRHRSIGRDHDAPVASVALNTLPQVANKFFS